MTRRTCAISDQGCLAPAGVGIPGVGYSEGDRSTRLTCSVCGNPVCVNCSKVLLYRGRFRRMCRACVEDFRRYKA